MNGNGRKVLICDDDRDILEVTSMLLEYAGFEVSTQSNSALLVAQALAEMPDLLLLDIWMPFLSGDQLTKQIKSNPKLEHIPIVLFSAAIDGKVIAKESGAEYFIEKPFDMDNLSALMNSVLN